MFKKTNKTVKRVTAWLCMLAMVLGMMVTGTSPVYAADGRKIDVWDLGCVQESDTTTYVNHITTDTWTNTTAVSDAGKFTGASNTPIDFKFGESDLTLTYYANDRLYGPVKSYGANSLATATYSDGYTAAGMYYCNGSGGESRRYFTMNNVVAGDKIIVYMTAHNAVYDTLYFKYLGTDGTQEDSVAFGNKSPEKYEFVAQYSGTYKIYTGSSAKAMYSRIMRVPGVAVSGTIDMGTCTATDYTVKLVNDTTGTEYVANVADGAFSAVVPAGYSYTAALSGATGFGFTNDSKKFETTDAESITGKSGVALVVEEKSTYTYSGSITGFDATYDISELVVTLTPPADSVYDAVKLNVAEDLTFSATLEPDVEYTIVLSGVNDYEVKNATTVNSNSDVAQNIEVGLKAVYDVSGNFVTLDGALDATVSALTFTNVDDNYVYAATIDGAGYLVKLRAGAYLATATVDGYRTTTHVVVEDGTVTKDLLFVSTATPGALERVSDIYVGYADKANNYATVNEAVDAATRMNPTSEAERITIHIAPGTYREQVIINVPYITLTNDEPSKEVLITWYYGIGYNYYSTATDGYYDVEDAFDKYDKGIANRWGTTVRVNTGATGFKAENITFEASFNRYITDEEIEDGVEVSGGEKITFVRKYGADVTSKAATERATALCAEADKSEFYNCKFYGSQDTLYTGAINGYFKNCFIEGNTDYVFGDGSDVVFDNCELSFYGYSTGSVGGYITAHRPNGAEYGYLFRNCTVTAGDDLTVTPGYLGRPWGADAKVAFVNTKLESADLIVAEGWTSMSGNDPAAANYKEYNTTSLDGAAVDTSSRTAGTVVTENPVSDVTVYFGSDWTPSYYVAEAATVEFATAPYVVSNGDINTPYPGNTFTVSYSLGENDANDASIIQWYSVNGSTETLVKTSTANVDKTYKLQTTDTGNTIKVVVTPTTVSGNTGAAASYTVEEVVRDGYEDPSVTGPGAVLGDGVNIFLAGDSTVKDYTASGMNSGGVGRNEGSWGESLQAFFNSDVATVVNYANGGRSARNFINEGSLDKIGENIGEGDYLFIQFGHNDSSNASGYLEDRYVPLGEPDANGVYPVTAGTKVATPDSLSKYGDTFYSYDCGGTFKWYLLQYINVAREAGATPVLVTPVARMYYTSEGTIKPHHDSTDTTTNTQVTSNNAYVTAVKQLAEEENVLLLDAFEITKKMYEDAYAADPSASNGVSTYGTQTMFAGDRTHSSKLGGFISAALIATDLQNRGLDISYAVQMPSQVLGEQTDGTVEYSVNGSSKLTAYAMETSYAEVATYWTTTGQALIDAIGAKAEELAGGTPSVTEYTVTVTADENGSASASVSKAAEGTTVTLTATANEGYEFDSWVVVSGGVTITNNQFTMPANAVEVKATFKAVSTGGDTPVEPADPVEAFVSRMYTVVLGRDAEEAGLNNWVAALKAGTHDGAGIAAEFVLGEEFELKNLDNSAFLDVLYKTFFNREADADGKAFWMSVLEAGNSREFVLSNFVNLDEFTLVCASYGIQRGVLFEDGNACNPGVVQFVNRLYTLVMGRDADKDGLYIWTLSLTVKAETAESAAKNFFNSEEYGLKNTDDATYVTDLYAVFMNREADADGLKFWTDTMGVGMTREEVLSEFAKSEEFKAIAAGYGLN